MAASGRKSIFITGAASGIGLACAKRFAGAGWFVGLADIDKPGLAAALQAIGPANGSVHPLDVRDREGWENALGDFGREAGGKVDVLLNNAGVARFGVLEDLSDADCDIQIDVNIKGAAGGRLVNIASCAGLYGSPKLAVYSATKFAVRGLSEALDIEYARHGVSVACAPTST
ncbi:SDR family oxidoreductase [Aphelenchoides fujianensis]|nr:SDR family oxidoreductase [Aphelenchoides fujianensis]